MNCSSCKRTTKTVQIGTGQYCASCGTRFESDEAKPAPSAQAVRRTMDLRPGAGIPAGEPPKRGVPAHLTHAKGGVLDLRDAKPVKAKATARPAVKHTIDHAAAAPRAHVIEHVAKAIAHPATERVAVSPRRAHFNDRFARAKDVPQSPQVSRFGQVGVVAAPPPPIEPTTPTLELPPSTETHHEALSRLVSNINHTTEQATHNPLAPKTARYTAVAAAVVIMGGYIWLQNYPKLAIQAAGSRAGLTASLPGYIPSSYNLSHTDTAPGLVTLNFASPSQSGALTIAQHRTGWDSSSLLDNYVSKQSANYTAVQGQGLTVYLFNSSQAAWVNHGVWYSIAGAAQLSREQILKIAYSL